MKRKIALVVNDDGIRSPGLDLMAELANEFWDVYVIAPEEERSGTGKAITMGPISVKQCKLERTLRAYAISGTPADAVLLGIDYLLPQAPEVVLSGVNLGPNLGIEDYLDSGTIGGAMEASIHGIPSLAASLAMSKEDKLAKRYEMRHARVVLHDLLKILSSSRDLFVKGDIVSLNVPHPDCRGVVPTSVSQREMRNVHTKVNGGYEIRPWTLSFYGDGESGSDVNAIVVQRKASISVVNVRLESQLEAAGKISSKVAATWRMST